MVLVFGESSGGGNRLSQWAIEFCTLGILMHTQSVFKIFENI